MIQTLLASLSTPVGKAILAVSVTSVILTGLFVTGATSPRVRVAHIGNSFQFVNDFPRTLQQVAQGKIVHQDSTLHGSLSFVSMLKRGNGMVKRWNSTKAWMPEVGLHDFGSCTVKQLLLGYDSYLTKRTYADHYTLDSLNPCFDTRDYYDLYDDDLVQEGESFPYDDPEAYLNFTLEAKQNPSWDYVIMNDQSVRPAIASKQAKSAKILVSHYAPMLEKVGATPVLIHTWAYWRSKVNMTGSYGIQSIPDFTAKLYQAYNQYAQVLEEALPAKQKPRVAPVGLAFLMVWEEDPYMWYTLFHSDEFHPSPHGSYLMACVVHATLFGSVPKPPPLRTQNVIDPYTQEVTEVEAGATIYFQHSRSMQRGKRPLNIPDLEETLYLRDVAHRVAVLGEMPSTLQRALNALNTNNDDDDGDDADNGNA